MDSVNYWSFGLLIFIELSLVFWWLVYVRIRRMTLLEFIHIDCPYIFENPYSIFQILNPFTYYSIRNLEKEEIVDSSDEIDEIDKKEDYDSDEKNKKE